LFFASNNPLKSAYHIRFQYVIDAGWLKPELITFFTVFIDKMLNDRQYYMSKEKKELTHKSICFSKISKFNFEICVKSYL